MPQQRLIYELRRAIDVARNSTELSTTWEVAVGRVIELCRENPTSTLRAHVLHNLGCTRQHWLRQLASKLPELDFPPVVTRKMRMHLEQMGICRDRQAVAIPSESPLT
jgi:hypothetical protein